MARGWESKTVEAQIEEAENSARSQSRARWSPAQAELRRKRESLLLSRSHVLQELQSARKAPYRRMLEEMLAHVERELAALGDR